MITVSTRCPSWSWTTSFDVCPSEASTRSTTVLRGGGNAGVRPGGTGAEGPGRRRDDAPREPREVGVQRRRHPLWQAQLPCHRRHPRRRPPRPAGPQQPAEEPPEVRLLLPAPRPHRRPRRREVQQRLRPQLPLLPLRHGTPAWPAGGRRRDPPRTRLQSGRSPADRPRARHTHFCALQEGDRGAPSAARVAGGGGGAPEPELHRGADAMAPEHRAVPGLHQQRGQAQGAVRRAGQVHVPPARSKAEVEGGAGPCRRCCDLTERLQSASVQVVQSRVPKERSEQRASSASMAMRAMLFGQEGFRGAPPARWGVGFRWGYNLLLCALPQRRTPDASRMAS